MLLAFSAKPEELDILMLSLTFGNVEVQKYVSGSSDCLSFHLALVTRQPPCALYNGTISWRTEAKCGCSCLRNVVTLFHYIEKERAWRKANGRPAGFETLDVRKPIGESMWCITESNHTNIK
jgi:hypothetical protein